MSRGFASGLLWGGVVSVLGLGAVSLLAPPVAVAPAAMPPETMPPETVPPALQPAANEPQPPAKPPLPDPAPVAAAVPEVPPEPAAPAAVPAPPESISPPGVTLDPPAALSGPGGRNPGSASVIGAGRVSRPIEPPIAKAPPVPEVELAPAVVELLPPPPLTPEEEALLMPVAREDADLAPAQIVPDLPAPAITAPAITAPAITGPVPPADAVPASPTPEQGLPAPGDLPGSGDETLLAPEADPQPARGASAFAGAGPAPIKAFARPFTNPEDKPVFVVLLVDTGGADLDRARLAALPFPVTFVIDPAQGDAAAAESIYRAAGQEVVILARGFGADATDPELQQILGAGHDHLPQAVAVADLSLPDQGFQDSRPLATRVVPVIAAQGRGLVTFDRGRNPADQVARREGVPSVRVFRKLDGEGETSELISRYLDRAAYRAVREGRVAVVGDTRPETVQALLEWTLQGRNAQVALAPLTAILAGN